MESRIPRSRWRRRAAAFLLASCLIGLETGCNKKEGQPLQGSQAVPETTSGIPSAEVLQGISPVSSSGGFSVAVAPSSPSRITPPSVSVKSPPRHGASILGVRWFVNGVAQGSDQTLSSSQFKRGDRIHAEVKLHAGDGEKLLKTIEVVAANALPEVTDLRIEPQALMNGSTVRAIAQALDPDGDPLTLKYKWYVDDLPVTGDNDSMILKGVRKGAWVHVTGTPNDGFADGAWRESPRYQVVNATPVVKSPVPTTIPPTMMLRHTIVAEDPDGDTLTYTLTKYPPGMVLAGSTLVWQVPEDYIGKHVEAEVVIADGDGGQTVQTLSMTVRRN